MTGHATGHDISIATTEATVVDPFREPSGKLATADRLGINDEYLLANARDVLQAALDGDDVYNNDGDVIGRSPNLTAANRALELLMKHRGMLAADETHEIQVGLNLTINGIDPEQLR